MIYCSTQKTIISLLIRTSTLLPFTYTYITYMHTLKQFISYPINYIDYLLLYHKSYFEAQSEVLTVNRKSNSKEVPILP